MTPPTQTEIDAEVAALEAVKPRVRRYSIFRDDNHAAIDAQIEVLCDALDDEDIDDNQDSGKWDEHVYASARDALNWKKGEAEDGSPSSGWEAIAN